MTSVENKEDSAKIRDIYETTSKTPWLVQAETGYYAQLSHIFVPFKSQCYRQE